MRKSVFFAFFLFCSLFYWISCGTLSSKCSFHQDCLSNQRCVSEVCVEGNCSNHTDCLSNEKCVEGKCAQENTQTSVNTVVCTLHSECQRGESCNNGKCANRNQQDLFCTTDPDCPQNEFCYSQKCIEKTCNYDSDCGAGFECLNKVCRKEPLSYGSFQHALGIISIVDFDGLIACSYSESVEKQPQRATKQLFVVSTLRQPAPCPNKAVSISKECMASSRIDEAFNSNLNCAWLREFNASGKEIYSYKAVEGVISSEYSGITGGCNVTLEVKFENGQTIKKNYAMVTTNFTSTICGNTF